METNMMSFILLRTSPHVTQDYVEEWLYLPRISCGLKARRHRSASTTALAIRSLTYCYFEDSARSRMKQIRSDERSLVSAEELRLSDVTGEKWIQ